MSGKLALARQPAFAALAGIALLLALAPYGYTIIQIISLAFIFHLILHAETPRRAFILGWAYGTGWLTASVYWLYFSMHQFGGMNALLAATAVLLLGAFMGLLPACATGGAAWLRKKFNANDQLTALCFLPAALTLAEWTRGWLFTGFPWAVLGYAHTDNALAGFAPIVGVYGVTLLAAVLAGATLILINRRATRRTLIFIIALVIILGGYALRKVQWTTPVDTPIKVRLLQGNIPQEMKFTPDQIGKTLTTYRDMITAAPADLTVTPETAVPIYLHMLSPDWFAALEKYVVAHDNTLAIGIPIADSRQHYTNSVIAVLPGSDKPHHIGYRYDKQHLVPFGEFVPPGARWFVNLMRIPLGDFARGPAVQRPFPVKGQWVLPNICYEDIFGEEIASQIMAAIKHKAPEPGILLNLSNIAWFGNTLALPQHLQISRMRAIETQRPMLRSTNTGMTAVIDAGGNVQGALPAYTFGTLETEIQGYNGKTPYIRFGNHLMLIICFILLIGGAAAAHTRQGKKPHPFAGRNDWGEL